MPAHHLSRRAILRLGLLVSAWPVVNCTKRLDIKSDRLTETEWQNVIGSRDYIRRALTQFQNQGNLLNDSGRLYRLGLTNMLLIDPATPQLLADNRNRREVLADLRAYYRYQERERAARPIDFQRLDYWQLLGVSFSAYSAFGVLRAFGNREFIRAMVSGSSMLYSTINRLEDMSNESRSEFTAVSLDRLGDHMARDRGVVELANNLMDLELRLTDDDLLLDLSPGIRALVKPQVVSDQPPQNLLTDAERTRLINEVRGIVLAEFQNLADLQSQLITQQRNAEAQAQATRARIDFAYDEIAGAVFIGGFILGNLLNDTKLAQNFLTIGNALNDAYRATSLFLMEPGGIGTLAYSGSMLTAGLAIYGAVSGQPNASSQRHEALMKALRAINKNINQLRREMHERVRSARTGTAKNP